MKRDTRGIKNILCESVQQTRLPREVQIQRLQRVIREVLTDRERTTLTAYYLEGKTVEAIAQSQGINRSTVSRNLKRAERKLKNYLRY